MHTATLLREVVLVTDCRRPPRSRGRGLDLHLLRLVVIPPADLAAHATPCRLFLT